MTYDELLGQFPTLVADLAESRPAPDDDEPADTEADALCSWCGRLIDADAQSQQLNVQDPVGLDDLELVACCAEHATHLRRRHGAN